MDQRQRVSIAHMVLSEGHREFLRQLANCAELLRVGIDVAVAASQRLLVPVGAD